MSDATISGNTPKPKKERKATQGYRRLMAMWRRSPYCIYCGRRLDKLEATIDHVIPRSRGGKNNLSNRAVSCYQCNQAKGDMTPTEWGLSILLVAIRWRLAAWLRS